MALLQISEPDQSARRYAVGIDLGTTNSLVAMVLADNQAEVIANAEGDPIMPSVVRYLPEKIVVGAEAKAHALTDPLNTLSSMKRLMGRDYLEAQQTTFSKLYQLVPSKANLPMIKTVQRMVSPVEFSAEILKALKEQAQASVNEELAGAVITVPAYFDDAQRQATKDAAKLAGINVLRLLNEPTAAAIAYGLDSGRQGNIAVFDLGGGTFDISILRFSEGVFEVIATGGDSQLGGDDMDNILLDWLAEQIKVDLAELTIEKRRELLAIAKEAKEHLANSFSTLITLPKCEVKLDREIFIKLIEPLLQRMQACCQQAMKDADLPIKAVDHVVLVGGATRTLAVRELAEKFFEQSALAEIDPDQVVALGAAIQANNLLGQTDNSMLLLDVLPLSLGLETMGGLVERIIPRNTTIPASKGQQFTTYKDGQTGLLIHVVQGERELVQDCRSLARFELTGIPPMKAGAAKVEVTFQVDADGLLGVMAKELSTGVENHVEVTPSYGLTEQEVTQMLQDSFSSAKEDVAKRRLVEKKVAGKQLHDTVVKALLEDGDRYLTKSERVSIEAALEQLAEVLGAEDAAAIGLQTESLERVTQAFAERRMDGSVRAALMGKAIEELPDAKD